MNRKSRKLFNIKISQLGHDIIKIVSDGRHFLFCTECHLLIYKNHSGTTKYKAPSIQFIIDDSLLNKTCNQRQNEVIIKDILI